MLHFDIKFPIHTKLFNYNNLKRSDTLNICFLPIRFAIEMLIIPVV